MNKSSEAPALSIDEGTIHPTNTCFDDALEYLERRVKADPSIAREKTLLLAHGICRIPPGQADSGHVFAHAWVEENGNVWQWGILETVGPLNGERVEYSIEKADFYREMRVREVTLYTLKEVHAENTKHGTYGPWLEKYQALTKDGRKSQTRGNHGTKQDSEDR